LLGMLLTFLGADGTAVAQAAAAPPACAVDYVASDRGVVTPSVVSGAPDARLTLYRIHPDNLNTSYLQDASDKADAAYLLAGDAVEQVETCDGYAYVRFDGPHRISTGWAKSDRLAPQGKPYRRTPATTGELCQAAAEIMNQSGRLPPVPLRPLDEAVARKTGHSDQGQIGQAITRLEIGGRVFTAVDLNDGGSCSSTYQDIWSGDLSEKLSPKTRQYDDPAFNLPMGRNEAWVEILGRPVLLGNAPGTDVFYISTMDDNGNIHTACKGSLQPLQPRRLLSSSDGKVCAAVVRGEEKADALGDPTGDSRITLSSPPEGLKPVGKPGDGVFIYEHAGPGEITYHVMKSGPIDLNNDGKPVRIALVAYESSSGEGCGSGVHLEVPVLIDNDGHVDPSEPANDAIFKRIGGPAYSLDSVPPNSMEARFVKVADGHYLDTTWISGGQQIWKLSGNKAMRVCSLQTLHYVVVPNDDVGRVN
jgi:hypothetical protein